MNRAIYRITFIFSCIVSSAFSGQVVAWGADAHRASGEIAWQLLEVPVQTEVKRLLKLKGETTLAEAGTWADRMRSNDAYDWVGPLHYINLPVAWDSYDKSRDCPEHGCILDAIKVNRAKLTDKSLSDIERAEALLFLVHFVEDIHQPMHTGLREDRGGNDVMVEFFGEATNLHALWDTHLPRRFINDWKAFATEEVDRLDRREVLRTAAGEPELWLQESHRLAHMNAYTDTSVLGEAYYDKNREVIALRLRQGGIRLAAVLNEALR
ncbi:S1/P1 nuclease [uncultured Microbulbifer sp.]|uniref:S1/P1 nuclease n=1 Tax=uncultured Microbulbifer sp. TaxID=348147 RepID=UPI00261BD5EE|nr:S1/P1 nuclease [uncultured Microbulbifer sp.]